MVSSFGIIVLESRENKEIDLYSDYTKNKLQALTFAANTSIWISLQSWDFAYNVHHSKPCNLSPYCFSFFVVPLSKESSTVLIINHQKMVRCCHLTHNIERGIDYPVPNHYRIRQGLLKHSTELTEHVLREPIPQVF